MDSNISSSHAPLSITTCRPFLLFRGWKARGSTPQDFFTTQSIYLKKKKKRNPTSVSRFIYLSFDNTGNYHRSSFEYLTLLLLMFIRLLTWALEEEQ